MREVLRLSREVMSHEPEAYAAENNEVCIIISRVMIFIVFMNMGLLCEVSAIIAAKLPAPIFEV